MVSIGVQPAGGDVALYVEIEPPRRYAVTIRLDGSERECTTDRSGAARVPGLSGGLVSLLIREEPDGVAETAPAPFRTAWVRL